MIGDLVADPDVEIEAFARDVDEPVEQIEPHVQLRIAFVEAEQRGREHVPAEAEAARNPQRAARHAAGRRYVFDEMIDIVEDLFSPRINPLAGLRHRDAARRAMQEPRAELLFEQRHALADVRGRHRELFGGRAEAREPHDDAEHAQIVEVRRIVHDAWKVD